MIAALPMYDFAWTASALDAVWNEIGRRLRASGVEAPERLTRGVELGTLWRDSGLLLGQTCGYPYRRELRDVVELLATPRFSFDGCEGADHCSLIVVRREDPRADLSDFRGARAAINARDSNTGMNLFRASVAPLARGERFFASVLVTGAHVASLRAIGEGEADIAAIDCVTFGLVARGDPAAVAEIRVLGRTPASPGLPFIASRNLPEGVADLVRAVLSSATDAPELAEAWAALGVVGIEVLPPEAYTRIDEVERQAEKLGYRHLC